MGAAAKVKMTPFDGKEIRSTTVSIRNTGDGLSAAMKVDPVELHHAETIIVAVECTVEKVRFDPIADDASGLIRVHMLKAGTATIIDEKVVRIALDEQERRIEAANGVNRLLDTSGEPTAEGAAATPAAKKAAGATKAAGAKRGSALPGGLTETITLQEAHENGEHASGLVARCPACKSEKAAAAAEAKAAKSTKKAGTVTQLAGRARKRT